MRRSERSKICAVPDRYVFDTNVLWHGLIPSDDTIGVTCRRLMQATDDGEIHAYASALSLVELPKVIRPELPIEKVVTLTDALRRSAITWVPLTDAIAMRARDLSLEQIITKAYDAVVLATAVEIRAHRLYTHDRDDFPIRQTIGDVRVRAVELPPELRQGSLDDILDTHADR